MARSSIQVIGLRDFQRRVRKAADYKPSLMKQGLNEVGEIVVHNAIPLMESQFVSDPSRLDHALENSLRAMSTTREGRVVAGYPKRVPYAGWWEFGGNNKRWSNGRGMNREWKKVGRSLYPALDKHRAEVVEKLEVVLNRIADIING